MRPTWNIRGRRHSLGCTLYACWPGRAPFVRRFAGVQIAAHQLSEPGPDRDLRQDVPPGPGGNRAGNDGERPEQRYQNRTTWASADRLLQGKGQAATPKAAPAKVVNGQAGRRLAIELKESEQVDIQRKTIAPVAVPRQTYEGKARRRSLD